MIRLAVETDKMAVITLLKQAHAAAGFDRGDGFSFRFEPAFAERLFLIHRQLPRCVCLVLDVEGVARGVLMGAATEHPFGQVWLARETVWFIEPHYRGLGAIRMLDAFENWAREHDCEFAGMAGMGDDPAVGTLYRRRGYAVAETHYLKAI